MPRKEKKYHFIYKTTNLLNGKYYIGMHSTNNLDDGYLGSGRRLRYSINKYGEENHEREILEFCDSRDQLKKREAEIVNLNEIAKVECMNLIFGGGGGWTLKQQQLNAIKSNKKQKWLMENDPIWAKRTKLNRQIAGRENWKTAHKEGKIKYDTFSGKSHTEETKRKISESCKGQGIGNKNSQYGTCWITNGIENKKIKKDELVAYISNGWNKGRKIK